MSDSNGPMRDFLRRYRWPLIVPPLVILVAVGAMAAVVREGDKGLSPAERINRQLDLDAALQGLPPRSQGLGLKKN
jgi:hypothetical protein